MVIAKNLFQIFIIIVLNSIILGVISLFIY